MRGVFNPFGYSAHDNSRFRLRVHIQCESPAVGLSYGYSWVLGKHWNIEATIGAGYLYLESDIYPCTHCGTKREKVKKHYVGPTQAALSAVYVF